MAKHVSGDPKTRARGEEASRESPEEPLEGRQVGGESKSRGSKDRPGKQVTSEPQEKIPRNGRADESSVELLQRWTGRETSGGCQSLQSKHACADLNRDARRALTEKSRMVFSSSIWAL